MLRRRGSVESTAIPEFWPGRRSADEDAVLGEDIESPACCRHGQRRFTNPLRSNQRNADPIATHARRVDGEVATPIGEHRQRGTFDERIAHEGQISGDGLGHGGDGEAWPGRQPPCPPRRRPGRAASHSDGSANRAVGSPPDVRVEDQETCGAPTDPDAPLRGSRTSQGKPPRRPAGVDRSSPHAGSPTSGQTGAHCRALVDRWANNVAASFGSPAAARDATDDEAMRHQEHRNWRDQRDERHGHDQVQLTYVQALEGGHTQAHREAVRGT